MLSGLRLSFVGRRRLHLYPCFRVNYLALLSRFSKFSLILEKLFIWFIAVFVTPFYVSLVGCVGDLPEASLHF